MEADEEIAEICRFNHRGDSRVQTVQCFVGENEGALVRLEDDGKANPTTKLVAEDVADPLHQRLDTLAGPFAEANGSLSLIKVDTEGVRLLHFAFRTAATGTL